MSSAPKRITNLSLKERRAMLAGLLREKTIESKSFPLSFAQQRLWFLDKFEPEHHFHNLPVCLRLNGPLHIAALKKSLNEIMRRHEVLRTTFVVVEEQPVQVIVPFLTIPLPVVDLPELPKSMREIEVLRLANQEVLRPFDLGHGPLLRATLLRLAAQEYVLLLTMHHIIADDRSLSVFVRELSALYVAYSTNRPSSLPSLPTQYTDFANWQRKWLQGETLERQLEYWKRQLADAPVLEILADHPRPAVQTFHGAAQSLKLPEELGRALEALSRREGVTPFMVFLAAFQTLLFRYTGQKDITVGSPIDGRNRAEFEELIGPFDNTFVLRSDLYGNPRFGELLGRVREVVLEAHAHQDLPFEKLVEELQPQRDLSRNPFFQIVFSLQNNALPTLKLADLTLSPIFIENNATRFDLTLILTDTGQEQHALLRYNTDLFETATITRMLEHLQVLLEGIVASPEQRLSELPLLTAVEQGQMLVEWNNTGAEYSPACLHKLFEAQVVRTPDAVAVAFEDRYLTYKELNRRANQLAHYLSKVGVGPEILVGICVDRSLEMVVGVLGILKSGGAYVPLDPAYPRERLALMLADAQVPVLLTQERLLGLLPKHEACILCLDADAQKEMLAQESKENPTDSVQLENLAYVIYTSGSTGRPKGVAMPHRPLSNLIQWQQSSSSNGTKTLQFTSLSFDVAFQELFITWCSGGTLYLIPDTLRYDPAALIRFIQNQSIERLFLPFVALQQLAQALETVDNLPQHLKEVITAGEQLKVIPAILKFFTRLEGCLLQNQYGPAESHVVTALTLKNDPTCWPVLPPIGRPITNAQIYLLDDHLQPVPIGVRGEIYIGGVALARGYLNQPRLTADRFFPNPFSSEPGARLYKTGDLARYLPDGNIEYLGRSDHQVKVRGYRIELGEIEAVLGQHPDIQESVVIVREDVPGDKRLVAYMVQNLLHQGDEQYARGKQVLNVRSFLQKRLPTYMIPTAFVWVETLPLTPSGKVDRHALPVPGPTSLIQQEMHVTPFDPLQEALADIWSRLLGIKQVSIYDDFFALGGHSLLAAQVISQVRQVFGIELPLITFFEAPTIAGLARHIKVAQQARQGLQSPALVPAPRPEYLPLSFAQQRIWFLDQLEPHNHFYNLHLPLQLRGPLHVRALEQCLSEIVRRHENLRTTFLAVEGQPQQVISPAMPLSLPVIDLLTLSKEALETEVLQLVTQEAQQPFALACGPLLRFALLRLGEQEHILLLTMHHIISDGWSLGILRREISVLYSAYAEGLPSPLPELPIQYADFAVWQRQWLQDEVLQKQLSYWKRQLAGAPPMLELLTDRPRPSVQTFRGALLPFTLPEELGDGIKALSRQERGTLFMTLLAAFQVLLSRYSRQEDIVVGSPIANRTRAEIEDLIGFFVNTLVLRTDLSGDPTFREVLSRVREVCLEAYAHQDLPFEKLVEELQPERDLSFNPLFQCMFVLQNAPRSSLKLANLKLNHLKVDIEASTFDITLYMTDTAEGLWGEFEYNTDLFDRTTIQRMAEQLRILLEGAIAQPDQHISVLPILPEAERQRLLSGWHTTQSISIQRQCIHHLFEDQVDRAPDAIGVVFGLDHLTYRELNQRANQVARYLQKLGVEAEKRVGICMEYSLEMMVGILGVLKAGGAYVPLDPAYPKARLALMMEDANISVLLTQLHTLKELPLHLGQTVCLDSDRGLFAQLSRDNLDSKTTDKNIAYVLYTSGSTGKAKGVLVSHRSLVNASQAWEEAYRLRTAVSSHLQMANFSFDVFSGDWIRALCSGGKLVFCPKELLLAPQELYMLLLEEKIDCAEFVPVVLRNLLHYLEETEQRLDFMKLLVVGSDRWFIEDVEKVQRFCHPETRCITSYGLTEATIDSTYFERVQENPQPAHIASIGRPFQNTQVYLLDTHLQPVPMGVPGELYIAGSGLARGYLNLPDLTAESFIPHPFSIGPGNRLYKTGDLARYLPDGNLEFLGRIDQQVKLRGFRIELGEIEAMLANYPSVQNCVVRIRENQTGDKQIVAYVVSAQRQTFSGQQLRNYLKERLPDYMIPTSVMILETLPLTPNGKVDFQALPLPDLAISEFRGTYVAPRTATEEIVAGIWAEVLKVERVGIYDNFFELGGHSLLVTQVVARLRNAFQLELPLRSLFEFPTPAEVAKEVEQGKANHVRFQESAIVALPREAHRVRASSLIRGGQGIIKSSV